MALPRCLLKAEIEEYLENLPAGFVFAPTDEELITAYLMTQLRGTTPAFNAFPFIDILNYTPDELQGIHEYILPQRYLLNYFNKVAYFS